MGAGLTANQITVAESQQMGALLIGIEKIAPIISRCQIYETLYLNGMQSEQEEWKAATASLTLALVGLYATMLRFLARAIRTYNQGTTSRALHATLSPAEVGFLDKIQSLENKIAIEADICGRIHTRQGQASSEGQIQQLRHILEDFQNPLILQIDSGLAALREKLDSAQRLKILEWISDIPYAENHNFACQGRTSGTGEWLLRHKSYFEWRASSASMMLWLHGDRECH